MILIVETRIVVIFYENCHIRNDHAEVRLGVFDNQRVFETMHNRTGLTITAVYRRHFCGKFVLSHSVRRLFLLLLLLLLSIECIAREKCEGEKVQKIRELCESGRWRLPKSAHKHKNFSNGFA